MRSYILIIFIILLTAVDVKAQQSVNGVVRDSFHAPVVGVRIRSTANKAIGVSDSEGKFKLNLSTADSLLVFTHIAYKNKTFSIPDNSSVITVTLEPIDHQLEEVEVISTGYQHISKERATGSFESINTADLERRVAANILDKLEGQVPGLQYDNRTGTAKINVRGINTMSEGLMGPLIVVDNFPFEGNLDDINPHDVASVTVLKDAAASSIWGARAGNGVIVINLKKPAMNKLHIDMSSNYTTVGKARIKEVPRISSADFIDVERMLFENGFYDASYNNLNTKLTIFSPVVEMLFANKNQNLSSDDLEREILKLRSIDYRDEVQKYLYRNESLQQHALAIANGNDWSSYRMSVSYTDTKDTRVGSGNKNLSINLQNTLKFTDQLDLSTRLTFLQAVDRRDVNPMEYGFSPGAGKSTLYPYAKLRSENGENLAVPYLYNSTYINSLSDHNLLDWRFVPLDEIGQNVGQSERQQVDVQANLKYAPTTWAKLEALYNYQGASGDDQFLQMQESFYTRNLINRFTQISNNESRHIVPLGGINQLDNSTMRSHKLRGNLAIDKTFFDGQHNVAVLAGTELSSVITNSNGYTVYGYDPILMTSQQVDLLNFYPIFDGLAGNSRIPSAQGFLETTRRFVSFFTNASYTWKQKYMASFSARRDASNLFGVNTNDKWNPLWSAGLAWSLDKEPFLAQLHWLSGLRLRGTYGHSGNSGGVATSLPTISYSAGSSSNLTALPRAMISSLPNPSLKWEDVRMINLALTFDLFHNMLSGSVEYFSKKSTDLLTTDNIDPTVGLSSVRRNVGILTGSGWDIRLSANKSIGNVRLSTTAFVSIVKDVVNEYRGNITNASTYVSNAGRTLNPLPDRRLYPVFALPFSGLDRENGDPQGRLNGEMSKDYQKMLTDSLQNITYYGTALPPRHGSIKQAIAWKRVNLSFLISYKFGHYFQKPTIRYNALFNAWTGHGDFADRWQSPGDENTTTVPSMSYPANTARDDFYAYSEANIEKGGIIRLQDINLNYTFAPYIGGSKRTLSVFGAVNNVALLWSANKAGLDPDYFNIPPSRRYSVGISFKF